MGARLHLMIATGRPLSRTPRPLNSPDDRPPRADLIHGPDMPDIRTFDQIQPDDGPAVGGKGLSLALMARAGLPVPPGFCITSAAHRRLRGQAPHADPALAGHIADAYRRLGGGAVAVRSSATAEDGAVTSFAGQQETVLGVRGEAELL